MFMNSICIRPLHYYTTILLINIQIQNSIHWIKFKTVFKKFTTMKLIFLLYSLLCLVVTCNILFIIIL